MNLKMNLNKKLSEIIIKAIEKRTNYIVRKSTNLSKQSQILAANIDRAYLLVTIHSPVTHLAFIDRFLVTAEAKRSSNYYSF